MVSQSDGVEAICVAWSKALRTICKVHPATHCDIITALSGQVPLLSNLKVRFGQFFKKCREHKHKIVNPMSCAGRNCKSYVMCRLRKCFEEMIDIKDGFKQCYIVKAAALVNPVSCAGRNFREVLNSCYDKKIIYNEWNSKCDEIKDCVNILKEMIDMKDRFKQLYFIQ